MKNLRKHAPVSEVEFALKCGSAVNACMLELGVGQSHRSGRVEEEFHGVQPYLAMHRRMESGHGETRNAQGK